ncbi:UNVERIFIED_CONTAM: hypothetical protein HDU68_006413 [Siphonaria sp. JEL0065]|nr:hypothetical protein HDU68_006413 [Siphonaria sp. JEL0065]
MLKLAGLDALAASTAPSVLPSTPKKFKLQKGSTRDVNQVVREFKIIDNMARMDEKIKAWKDEKTKAKQVKKQDLPF